MKENPEAEKDVQINWKRKEGKNQTKKRDRQTDRQEKVNERPSINFIKADARTKDGRQEQGRRHERDLPPPSLNPFLFMYMCLCVCRQI